MTDSPLAMTLPSGEIAHIHETDGHKTSIKSPLPAPPGATVRGRISGIETEFQLKVRDCRKEGDVFLVSGRLQNVTRELRAKLTGS